MTNEEAISVLKDNIDTYVVCHGEEDTVAVSIDNVDVEAFDMAIKALEQEPILDKIKGYIDHIRNTGMGKKKSLEFIEKFIKGLKAESEKYICR